MRNLKRALSLALASVMVASMTLIGAGAVSVDDFSDSADIVNKEAVTVLATLGVITGNDDGSYAPADTISRAEMSTIICRVLNGGKDPVLGESVTNTYTDTASHWAKNYIEYCTTLGIIAGKGDGTFDPEGDVTVAEAAKMVLVALGYNAPMEGYTGANWQINVDARANPLGLYDDLSYTTTSSALTRDNAAQMLYNALDCYMVKYSVVLDTTSSTVISTTQLDVTDETLLEDKFEAVKVEGVVIANEVANLEASASGNGTSLEEGRTKIRIDEEADQDYYTGDKTFSVSSEMDDLGRYVAIYVKKDRNSVNAQVLGSVIVSEDNKVITDASSDDIQTVIDDNDLNRTEATMVAKNYQGLTALTSAQATADGTNGVQKIIIDNDNDGDVDYVLLNTYYFGKVTTYVSSGDGSIAINVGDAQTTESYFSKTVTRLAADDMDDVVGFEDVAKGDYVNAQFIGGDLHVSLAESVTGVLESYRYNDNGTLITKVTVDGTDYNVSNVTGYVGGDDDIRKAANDADEFVSNEVSAYLDNNGYVVAVGDAEANAGKYAMVLAVGSDVNDLVKVILADGTVGTYTIDDNGRDAVKKSALDIGEVYAYNLNTTNNTIKLTEVDRVAGETEQDNAKFSKGKIRITTGATTDGDYQTFDVTSSTVFFYVSDDDGVVINDSTSIDDDNVDTYANYRSAPDLKSDPTITATIYTRGTGADERIVAVVFAGTDLADADVSDNLYIANIVGTNGDETEIVAYVNGSTEPQNITLDQEIGELDRYRRTTWTYSVNTDGTYHLDSEWTRSGWTVSDVVGDNFVINNGANYTLTSDTLVVNDSKYLPEIVAELGADATVSENDNVIGMVVNGSDEALLVVIRNEKVTTDDETAEASVVLNGTGDLDVRYYHADGMPSSNEIAAMAEDVIPNVVSVTVSGSNAYVVYEGGWRDILTITPVPMARVTYNDNVSYLAAGESIDIANQSTSKLLSYNGTSKTYTVVASAGVGSSGVSGNTYEVNGTIDATQDVVLVDGYEYSVSGDASGEGVTVTESATDAGTGKTYAVAGAELTITVNGRRQAVVTDATPTTLVTYANAGADAESYTYEMPAKAVTITFSDNTSAALDVTVQAAATDAGTYADGVYTTKDGKTSFEITLENATVGSTEVRVGVTPTKVVTESSVQVSMTVTGGAAGNSNVTFTNGDGSTKYLTFTPSGTSAVTVALTDGTTAPTKSLTLPNGLNATWDAGANWAAGSITGDGSAKTVPVGADVVLNNDGTYYLKVGAAGTADDYVKTANYSFEMAEDLNLSDKWYKIVDVSVDADSVSGDMASQVVTASVEEDLFVKLNEAFTVTFELTGTGNVGSSAIKMAIKASSTNCTAASTTFASATPIIGASAGALDVTEDATANITAATAADVIVIYTLST